MRQQRKRLHLQRFSIGLEKWPEPRDRLMLRPLSDIREPTITIVYAPCGQRGRCQAP
jgi:hypothetical protein